MLNEEQINTLVIPFNLSISCSLIGELLQKTQSKKDMKRLRRACQHQFSCSVNLQGIGGDLV